MPNKIAIIGIIVENLDSVEKLNILLHNYSKFIIGRLGLPYKERAVNIISIAVDAPERIIHNLTEKIGAIDGISSNTAVSK